MKKIFILFAVFLLVFSSFVIADRDDDMRERAEYNMEDARERIEEGMDSARVIRRNMEDNIENAKQRIEQARRDYEEVKEMYEEKRRELFDSKEGYRECLNSEDDKCIRVVKEVKSQAKLHLEDSIELILKKLNELKVKTESSKYLTDGEISELLMKIDDQIEKMENLKSRLEGISENPSREEIKNTASEIRNSWREIKLSINKIRLEHFGARFRTLIERAETLGNRAREEASSLQSDEINPIIDDYFSKVEDAKNEYSTAREIWEQESTPGNIDELVRESQGHMKEANNHLKEARRILNNLIKRLRDNDREISLEFEGESQ